MRVPRPVPAHLPLRPSGVAMIEPQDVLALLNAADASATLTAGRGGTVPVHAAQLRELVTVWLRVAALFEQVEQNPTDFDPELRCAVEALLLGKCGHLVEKTEPQNDKPEPPTLKCTCGYHGPANDDFSCPHCGEMVS